MLFENEVEKIIDELAVIECDEIVEKDSIRHVFDLVRLFENPNIDEKELDKFLISKNYTKDEVEEWDINTKKFSVVYWYCNEKIQNRDEIECEEYRRIESER